MSTDEIKQRYQAIEDRANTERKQLADEVLAGREFQDGQRMRRIRLNDDGTVYDDIEGTIVGARVAVYDFKMLDGGRVVGGYPNVYYGVRVDSPATYESRQSSSIFDIEHNKYEDFWQGDGRWTPIQ